MVWRIAPLAVVSTSASAGLARPNWGIGASGFIAGTMFLAGASRGPAKADGANLPLRPLVAQRKKAWSFNPMTRRPKWLPSPPLAPLRKGGKENAALAGERAPRIRNERGTSASPTAHHPRARVRRRSCWGFGGVGLRGAGSPLTGVETRRRHVRGDEGKLALLTSRGKTSRSCARGTRDGPVAIDVLQVAQNQLHVGAREAEAGNDVALVGPRAQQLRDAIRERSQPARQRRTSDVKPV
jgi:hypothetical protein